MPNVELKTQSRTQDFATKYGRFSEDGLTYIVTDPKTPRPWINVVSNGAYGFVISQMGGGFSWWENSNLARLTSWQQDLVRDESGKFLYIRDDDTGEFWSAALNPVGGEYDHYEVRHSVGYTTFIHRRKGIEVRWTMVVPPEDACELWSVQIRNLGSRPRKLSVFSYLEWCLGNGVDWHREFQKTFIETAFDKRSNALSGLKRRMPLPETVSAAASEIPLAGFHAVNRQVASYSGDKEDFIGLYNGYRAPRAVVEGALGNVTGRWGDSIASLHVTLTLDGGAEDTLIFVLGKEDEALTAASCLEKYGHAAGFRSALEGVQQLWRPYLEGVQVKTPDAAFDLMTNIWMKYQAISCRIWARTAYYQSSAAYGYRDQLQDSHIFLPLEPERTKQQILLHAAHQYRSGKVLHWWFPIIEKGPDSHHSDTPAWLVYLTLSYIDETGDLSILKEKAEYLDGAAKPLLDHCVAALESIFKDSSRRGLPLILSGDWNDGMSFVGMHGKGESIWLAFFVVDILSRLDGVLAELRESKLRVPGYTPEKLGALRRRFKQKANRIKTAVNTFGWDGRWYWRATRDDGTKLGSKQCKEGKLFLNAQTWAVISGAAPLRRAETAMDSVETHLLREYGPLLFTPAYTVPDESVGYLTRYAPGIRENGGVYSHAATWAVIAECLLGRAEKAYEVYSKLCPAKRGMLPELYAGEPYAMPGNTEGPESPYFGRAGWTWYTGSAAWMFRVACEWILGVRPVREGLRIDPCVPAEWREFSIKRIFRGTTYEIEFDNPGGCSKGVQAIWLDGEKIKGCVLPDIGDGKTHQVRVLLGSRSREVRKKALR